MGLSSYRQNLEEWQPCDEMEETRMKIPEWGESLKWLVQKACENSGIDGLRSWCRMVDQASNSYVSFGFHINQPCEGCRNCVGGYNYRFVCSTNYRFESPRPCTHPQSCPVRKTRCFGKRT